jgi:hypothetical protein
VKLFIFVDSSPCGNHLLSVFRQIRRT